MPRHAGERPHRGMSDANEGPALIREYHPADAQRLYQIDQVCFPGDIAFSRAELRFCLKHPSSVAKIAEEEGRVVGFALGRVALDGAGHVLTLDVIPEARRRGVGTALLTALHEEFMRRNVAVSVLEVDTSDSGARCFYERMGYEWVETIRGYYNGRRDAYRMICFMK